MKKTTEENEEKIVNLCINKKAPLHNFFPFEIDIVMVNPDGSTEIVGQGITCVAASGFNQEKWECWMSPTIIRRTKNFPSIARKDCILPSYWLKFAWHFVKLDNSRVVDFNSVGCVPQGNPEKFTDQAKRIISFRTKHPHPDDAIEAVVLDKDKSFK